MSKTLGFIAIVLVCALMRLIPHPPNFTPMLAIALFAGAKSPHRGLAYFVPVLALLLSDFLLGMHNLMWVVAACLIVTTLIGSWSERHFASKTGYQRVGVWALSGLVASVLFFLITNIGVWAASEMYPHTGEGLWTCFVMALPFFHNQIVSTWVFAGVLFVMWDAIVPVFARASARARF
jgi:hypothetical protein